MSNCKAITLSPNSITLTLKHILVKMKCLNGKPCTHTIKKDLSGSAIKTTTSFALRTKVIYTKQLQVLGNDANDVLLPTITPLFGILSPPAKQKKNVTFGRMSLGNNN